MTDAPGIRPDGGPERRRAASPRWRRWAILISVLAVFVRLGAAVVLGDVLDYTHSRDAQKLEWDWGYEQAAVAQSVAEGKGFANPFQKRRDGPGADEVRPTAWAAPVYPLLLGGLIRVFGGITREVAWILAAVQILAASSTCYLLWRLGRDLYSQRAGICAALLWAFHPMAVYLPVALVWDSTLVAMFITWFLAVMLERGRGATMGQVAGLGVLLGATLLVNPAPLALAPMIAWYYLRPRLSERRFEARGIPRLAVLFAVAGLVVSPWIVRNVTVLGTPQIRSNLGVEVFVGNNDGAMGPFNAMLHPAYNAEEGALYRSLGEVAYASDAMDRGLHWIRSHPTRFAHLTLERFQRFWFGPDPTKPMRLGTGFVQERDWMSWIKWVTHALMGALALAGMLRWKGRPGSRTVMRGTLIWFPLVYYVTHVFERYRFPIEPIVTLAAAVFVVRLVFGGDSELARPDRRRVG